jgi:predicted RNA-binding protein with PUA-like domain
MAYWLFKTEPDTFSIDNLKLQKVSHWEGVRNYQARNMMRDQMQLGDLAFIYHSSCKKVGIVGIAEVVKLAYPDHTQFDPKSPYFDSKSTPDSPRWWMVDLAYRQHLDYLSLASLKVNPKLTNMPLVQKGNRLSIMPVSEKEWRAILAMSD